MTNEEIQVNLNLGITPKFPYTVIDAVNEVELSIGIEDSILYVAFLGSSTKMDWVHNFMFWKVPYKQMDKVFLVHAGFLKIYKLCQDPIHKFIKDNSNKFNKIVISGHSLGGAIASLCCEDMSYFKEQNTISNTIPIQCITTGTPRVFTIFGYNTIKNRCKDVLRVVYGNDKVARLPPRCFLFKHVGTELHSVKANFFGILHPSAIYHHDVSRYLDFFNDTRIDTAETNYLFSPATKVYNILYTIVGILGLIGIALLIFL